MRLCKACTPPATQCLVIFIHSSTDLSILEIVSHSTYDSLEGVVVNMVMEVITLMVVACQDQLDTLIPGNDRHHLSERREVKMEWKGNL